MALTDNKRNIADRADADSRARERSKAMSDALRTDLDNRKARQRARQEAAGIPTSAPINGVDPEVQAERDERRAARDADAPSMSDILRGTYRRGNASRTVEEQTRGHRR